MLGLLRTEGPATATSLAQDLGLNTGATSYHLRQLAEHGFIEEETERGNARDRWWRAVHESTRMSTGDAEPEAEQAYLQAVALTYGEQLSRAAAERPFLPSAWDEAVTLSDWPLRLKPAAARRLLETLIEVIENTPDDPDADATYTIQLGAFPLPGQGLEE
ncbi:putative ArsR family transcriptional regulator [Nocardioides salarius]|uniref:ArsR family transcriptional regulator n=2 Tax=Nocardioides salarius TaxID=374513 RepID=A0ABS2MGE0_9ACTN|nr:putative ArsR family transcriptional regulator [Nocardioides salarius]